MVRRLQREGFPVLAVANPLRGVDTDAAYLDRVLLTISGSIVLAGHSYGGVVITNASTGSPGASKALVYIAAFAPEAGETIGLQTQLPGSKLTQAALDIRAYPLPMGRPALRVTPNPPYSATSSPPIYPPRPRP